MGPTICMNECCRSATSLDWKRGWGLKSGGFATLCYSCGLAYENLTYCDKFHLDETGWRECKYCRKRIHCGCIASKYLHEFLDFGGVGCIRCVRDLEMQLIRPLQNPSVNILNRYSTLLANSHLQSSVLENRINSDSLDKADLAELIQLGKGIEQNEPNHFFQSQKADPSSSNGHIKQEENLLTTGEVGGEFSHLTQQSIRPSIFSRPDISRSTLGLKDMYDSVLPFPDGLVEGTEKNKVPQFQELQKARLILPKPPKAGVSIRSVANKGMDSQTRVPRPPGEGRGRNQLLPRYWPRITDQELQQLSGDLNSTIVPLFEKVLSASDAGRIGRLVLPKACAEAYFPPISQSEGLPIRIQDIKGKEWTFQFRFWPNNNSRMYVLEGVTPCIQNMNLQAGDTVTFSKIEPGGKLVMGYRRATNSVDVQDAQTSAVPNGDLSGETSFSCVNANLPTDSSGWSKNEENGDMKMEYSLQQPMPIPDKKKARNIGSKSKRLLIHREDAMELTLSWEEAQQLLRPPLSRKPTIVMVENHAFEEYDAPPVLGKKTMFTARASGEQEQWAQCDSCGKWRRLPVDVLLPPKWTCSENIWDSNRCSCSAADEINPMKLESCFGSSKDFKRRRITEHKVAQENEPSGLDALATAAGLGDDGGGSGEPSVGATTTRHPRHRPGCSCIVCIQPPSGKGKHKPSCVCNVCLTVRRRFKTLMLRKKKRQSEREAEIIRERDQVAPSKDEEVEMDDALGHTPPPMTHSENGMRTEVSETSKGHLDLNCHPNREDDLLLSEAEETLPFGMYFRQNGVPSFGPCLLSKAATEIEGHPTNEGRLSSIDPDRGNADEER